MKRTSLESEKPDADQEKPDNRMGLAPVFAAAFAAACCLAVPLLVGLMAGSTATASSSGSELLSLFIIGFALAGVLVVVLSYWRVSRKRSGESPQGKAGF